MNLINLKLVGEDLKNLTHLIKIRHTITFLLPNSEYYVPTILLTTLIFCALLTIVMLKH